MKIVQIITLGSEIYGAQRFVFELCKYSLSAGDEVVLLCGEEGGLTEEARKLGCHTEKLRYLKREIRPFADLMAIWELMKVLRRIKPDVVASHSSKAGLVTRIACFLLGIRNVFTAHGWSFAGGIPVGQRTVFLILERLVGVISDRIICVSKADKELAVRRSVATPEKIHVIYFGVEEDGVPAPYHAAGKDEDLILAMTARFSPQKDPFTLIRALEPLRGLKWKLLLLGDGPQRNLVEELIAQLDLQEQVLVLGRVSNVKEVLQKSHVFTLITNWEGLPISIMEALLVGLPVIATRVDGIPEQVKPGYNGWLVEPKNRSQLTAVLQEVMENRSLLETYARNSRELFSSCFTLQTSLETTYQLYQEMIRTGQGKSGK